MWTASLDRWAPHASALLRIIAALLLWQYGLQKILGLFPATPPRPGPAIFSLSWAAGMIELIFSPLLAAGLFTRAAAFILSGEMAFAYWISHAPRNAIPLLNGGGPSILFCFVFLYFVFAGGGAWSLDALLRRGSAGAAAQRTA